MPAQSIDLQHFNIEKECFREEKDKADNLEKIKAGGDVDSFLSKK